MAIYRRIYTKIWSDPWFETLSPSERLFFIYLFSNENTSPCGMYQLSLRRMAFDMQMSQTEVAVMLEKFEQDGKAYYDQECSLVWVRKLREHNESSSAQLQKRIAKDINSAPDCDLKRMYLAHYHVDTIPIPSGDDVDTISRPPGDDIDTLVDATGQDRNRNRIETGQDRSRPACPALSPVSLEKIIEAYQDYNDEPISSQDEKQLASWCDAYGVSEVWEIEQRGIVRKVDNLGGWMRRALESQDKNRHPPARASPNDRGSPKAREPPKRILHPVTQEWVEVPDGEGREETG